MQPVTLAELNGVWTADHPRYADRFLQFDDQTITFGRGPDGVGSYAIDRMDSEQVDNSILVHIRFLDLESNEYDLNFYYSGQGGGKIWMKHQKGVYWFHSNAEPTHTPDFQ